MTVSSGKTVMVVVNDVDREVVVVVVKSVNVGVGVHDEDITSRPTLPCRPPARSGGSRDCTTSASRRVSRRSCLDVYGESGNPFSVALHCAAYPRINTNMATQPRDTCT